MLAVSFIRTLILFSAVGISIRIMGKRQLGELEPSELVVAVLISNVASQPLQDPGTPLLYGLIPVLTLLCCQILISGILIKSIRLRALICGRPSIIISDGKIIQKEMVKNRVTLDELGVQLRKKEVTDIRSIKHAILETDGTLSILLFPSEAPLTPNDLKINVDDNGFPVTLISNGRVLNQNLKIMNLSENWLTEQLQIRGASSPNEVYIFTIDSGGNIYYIAKEGKS